MDATHTLNIIIRVLGSQASASLKKAEMELKTVAQAIDASAKSALKQNKIINSAFGGMADVIESKLTPSLSTVDKGLFSITDAISASQQRLGGWINPIDQVTAAFKRTGGKVIDLNGLIKKTTMQFDKELADGAKKANQSFKQLQGTLLSVGLALLFTGMAIERFFGGMLKSIWTTWSTIIGVHDKFFQKTQQLTAAWEFFKFALFDALSQSTLFIALIDGVIQLIDWFGQLSPEVLRLIMYFVIIGFILGLFAMIAGQVGLALTGLIIAMGFFGIPAEMVISTLGLLISALFWWGLVIAAVAYAWTHNWLGMKTNLTPLLKAIGSSIFAFAKDFVSLWGAMWMMIDGLMTGNTEKQQTGWKKFTDTLKQISIDSSAAQHSIYSNLFAFLTNTFEVGLDTIAIASVNWNSQQITSTKSLLASLKDAWTSFFGWVLKKVEEHATAIAGKSGLGAVAAALKAAVDKLKKVELGFDTSFLDKSLEENKKTLQNIQNHLNDTTHLTKGVSFEEAQKIYEDIANPKTPEQKANDALIKDFMDGVNATSAKMGMTNPVASVADVIAITNRAAEMQSTSAFTPELLRNYFQNLGSDVSTMTAPTNMILPSLASAQEKVNSQLDTLNGNFTESAQDTASIKQNTEEQNTLTLQMLSVLEDISTRLGSFLSINGSSGA